MSNKSSSLKTLICSVAFLGHASIPQTSIGVDNSERVEFPNFVSQFHSATALRQEDIQSTFSEMIMFGTGSVSEVVGCGIFDDSKKYSGSDCYKVVLDNGSPRAVLYYGSKDRGRISQLNTGQQFTFENCEAISITNWGFWSTATCDMP
ncbi:MAG: hypothetical protein Q8L60_01075 [Gammaproteobacteria bacterium]|nr:hypothetical protein [Gammaproteobacteria bacterium]MDP2346375.1 hypothetical protein [Gammaproteobacteria bacterium]